MKELTLPVLTGVEVVWGGALHLGASLGWHTGTGIEKVEEKLHDESEHTRRELLFTFLKQALHHYDIGVLIAVISLAVITGVTNWALVVSFVALGFGAGLVYSDREDNPPQGIVSYTLEKFKSYRKKRRER